ncbi:MAG: recombinase family protein [Mesorhizobium sp.]|uniref:recombinase family protein n=1 Tax=Mesorhizobium sp. M7A.F.Ca.ET.027.02.1.1 TaxID=2496655 RepID=UPI000FD2B96B|nr:recombinase family protein [Mesorhizobium sp. M7A.F.Ca.ET.027.02.1.1]RVD15744.1 recombinase family protein [Mesorhizobium sp. M7A.F.Ca.ET.027.02.1.1]RWD12872.1 MAG: recombinase family protein [Mesorhizobium sp.]
MKRYVIYKRVSTEDQGRSGLGLEAQQRDIAIFLKNFSEEPFEIVGTFTDVLSGASESRPEFDKALALVRKTGAEMLVAKLDRLGRKVAHIANLMEDRRVRLRVAQMPHADKFQLHIYAALAEQEREFISRRTKDALQAAKARGTKLGGLRDKTMARNVAIQEKARQEAGPAMAVIGPMRAGGETLMAIAEALNRTGVATSRGGRWTAKQVSRVIDRASAG